MELIVGTRDKRNLVTIDNFLSLYPVVPLNERIGATPYQLLKSYAKSHGLHIFDSLIAATALENALALITLNRKHYEVIEALPLKVPITSRKITTHHVALPPSTSKRTHS